MLVATTAPVIAWGPSEKPKDEGKTEYHQKKKKKKVKTNIARHLNSYFTAMEKNAVCFL